MGGAKFYISARPEIFYASYICGPSIKNQAFASDIMDLGASGSVFLSPARFQRATARALTPNIELVGIDSMFRKWFNNPTVFTLY